MPTGAATTYSTAPATTTSPLSQYQSPVASHFPMKTMLTLSGPMVSTSTTTKASSVKPELSLSPTSFQHCNGGGLLDANGSMAAAFAMSTAPGSHAAAAVVCKVPKFLRSLYAILETEDPNVIAWVENHELKPRRVTAFHILDMERFERAVLPKYFKHQKFASFQRQLNNFGFRKWTKTQSSGVCTFSHNSFPPDPTTAIAATSGGSAMRATFREQWRQKSPISASPLAMASSAGVGTQPPRRRVGNGITKADRKNSRRAAAMAAGASGSNHLPSAESFMDLYKSPLNSLMLCDSSGRQQMMHHHSQHSQQYAPSHQPATKKLARPLPEQQLSGLEAFCDDTYKQFVLPPLQPQHPLHATTPRGLYATAMAVSGSSSDAEPTTPNLLGGFPHARNLGGHGSNATSEYSNSLKPYDFADKLGHHTGGHSHGHSHSQSMDASFNGAFLEPWTWDANMNTALELGAFPLDFDWQDAAGNNSHNSSSMHHAQQQMQQMQQLQSQTQHLANVSVSVGVAPLQLPQSQQPQSQQSQQSQSQSQSQHKDAASCHPHDRAMAPVEEFGFETFLFAE